MHIKPLHPPSATQENSGVKSSQGHSEPNQRTQRMLNLNVKL